MRCREINWRGQADCAACTFREGTLFSDLDEETLEHLLMPADKLAVGPKGVIYQEGDHAHHVFTIRAGLVKLVQKGPGGVSRIVRFLGPGQVAGLEALTVGTYHHMAEALVPTHVCRLPRETLQDIAAKNPDFFGQIMLRWQDCLDKADQVITQLSTGAAQGRVARFLLNTLCEPGADTCPAISRDDMAAILSVTIETVSRIVADFKRQGLLTEHQGTFQFDREALAPFAKL